MEIAYNSNEANKFYQENSIRRIETTNING